MSERVNYIAQSPEEGFVKRSEQVLFCVKGIPSSLREFGSAGLVNQLLMQDPDSINRLLHTDEEPLSYRTLSLEENTTVGALIVYVQSKLNELMAGRLTINEWEDKDARNPHWQSLPEEDKQAIKAWYELLSYLGKFMAAGNLGLIRTFVNMFVEATPEEKKDLNNEGYLHLQKIAMNFNPWKDCRPEDLGKMGKARSFSTYALASLRQLRKDLLLHRGEYSQGDMMRIREFLNAEEWLVLHGVESQINRSLIIGVLTYLREQKKPLPMLAASDLEAILRKKYDENRFIAIYKQYGELFNRQALSLDEVRIVTIKGGEANDESFPTIRVEDTASATELEVGFGSKDLGQTSSFEVEIILAQRVEMIDKILDQLEKDLSPRTRDILERKYAVGRYAGLQPATLDEIAEVYGFQSRDRVRQILARAILWLKHPTRWAKLRAC